MMKPRKAFAIFALVVSILSLSGVGLAQKNAHKTHFSISPAYGQKYFSNGTTGDLLSLALDIAVEENRTLSFEASHYRYHHDTKQLNSNGVVVSGNRYSLELSDLRAKYQSRILELGFVELIAGPFATLFYQSISNIPNTTTGYPIHSKRIGLGFGGELKSMFWIEEEVGVFIGTNLTVMRGYHLKLKRDNPTLLEQHRTSDSLEIDLLDGKPYWNVGLRLRLW